MAVELRLAAALDPRLAPPQRNLPNVAIRSPGYGSPRPGDPLVDRALQIIPSPPTSVNYAEGHNATTIAARFEPEQSRCERTAILTAFCIAVVLFSAVSFALWYRFGKSS